MLSAFRGNIHVLCILSAFLHIIFIDHFTSYLDRNVRTIFHIHSFSKSELCTILSAVSPASNAGSVGADSVGFDIYSDGVLYIYSVLLELDPANVIEILHRFGK